MVINLVLWLIDHQRQRRRINYRVHMNEPVGPSQGLRTTGVFVVRAENKDVADASLVLIRVSNSGRKDIDEADFVAGMRFSFGGRTVVAVERFEFRPPDNRLDSVTEGLSFDNDVLTLPRFAFNTGERFKMLVLLSGTGDKVKGEARIRGGSMMREAGPVSGHSRRLLAMAAVTLLAVGSIVGVLIAQHPGNGGGNPNCVPGTTTIAGSTAFAPTMMAIAGDYESNCPGATIKVVPESSADALTAMLFPPPKNPSAAPNAVMYDGTPSANVRSTALAAISFAAVVNQKVPVTGLSSAQLRAIFSGQVTNWHDVDPALDSMPIVAVEREPSSGTRQTFDKYVLDPILEAPTKVCPAPGSANAPATVCSANDTPTMLNIVQAVPGAIGYAELSASDANSNLRRIQIDSHDPDLEPAIQRAVAPVYPFWTTEHLLTLQAPPPNSVLAAFVNYLIGDKAQNDMNKNGNFPCVGLRPDQQTLVCQR